MKNKVILMGLLLIIIIETILLTTTITKKETTKEDTEMKNVKEPIEWFNFEPLVEFFGENITLTTLKFTSPQNLFDEEIDESTLIYDFLSINNFEESRKVELDPTAQQEYAYKFTIKEIQTYIKDRFNYEYSIAKLEDVFKYYYDEETKNYLSPPWTSSPVQVPPAIKEIYYRDGYYYIEFNHSLNEETPGKMVIKKENKRYYLYSCTGISY